jgi:LVIVD repeat-containing protein
MKRPVRREMFGRVVVGLLAVVFATAVGVAWAQTEDALDPAHNFALPCEAVSTPGLVPRSAKNIAHLANVCGVVGTDVEFQSRMAADGMHDYAFLGTMGGGLRIFDVTDPAAPRAAGRYTDPGWQNDVQVRGDLAVVGFDPVGTNPSASLCLQGKGASGGVDLVRLEYDRATADFTTSLLDCVSASPSGGAHNSALHPSGKWLAMINPRTHGSVDIVDLRSSPPRRIYRVVQTASLTNAACAGAAVGQCISNGRPGTWSPHDVHFSNNGRTMYVAAIGNDTVLVDVSNVLSGTVATIGVAPNDSPPTGDVATNPQDVSISHQSDVTSDGAILAVTDERGGGLQQTSCNTAPNGVIGGMHFWALQRISGVPQSVGASPASPKRIGGWFYPNPLLALDPLDPVLATLPRTERACTIHVFRLGGNGTSSPGAIQKGFDGVSRLPKRQAVSAHYGAGVWHIDLSRAPSASDGIAESAFTTWGNTLGWNVMPGADTWSAKEYKGFIYAGDMARGFDVYGFMPCEGAGCIDIP